jgi:hypothetical protein
MQALPMLQTWVLPAFLGLGLSAATGLRTFLPLLMMSAAVRFGLLGLTLNPHVAWLGSTPVLLALGVATVAELLADKVPVVDHALHVLGTVTRPLAGALAAGAVFAKVDPGTAAIAGLIIGAPTALAFHGVQASARVASTTTTAGLGNPVLSLIEDLSSGFLTIVSMIAPILAAILVAVVLVVGVRIALWLRRRRSTATS